MKRARHLLLNAAAVALVAGAPMSLAMGGDGGTSQHHLDLATGTGATTLRLDGVPLRTTSAGISRQRVITFPGSRTVLSVWDEASGGASISYFALSLDEGHTVAQVMPAPSVVRLKYAQFDPAGGEPAMPKELAASPDNELYLVQFVSTPLDEMRAAIRAQGGIVLRFLTENTHIVRMSSATRAKVAALPYVRWVGAYHPVYRLESSIRRQLASGGPAGEARYSIECLQVGASEQQAVADFIAKLGGKVHVLTRDQYRMEATLTRDQLLRVARRNEVSYIDPWGGPGGVDDDQVRQITGADPTLSGLGMTGQGVRGEVFDTEVRLTHQAFQNRPAPLLHGGSAGVITTQADYHGTSTYAINFGVWNGQPNATGMVPDAEQGIFCWYQLTTQFGGSISRLAMNQELIDPAGPYRAVYQSSSVGSNPSTDYNSYSAEVDDYLLRTDLLSCQSQSNNASTSSRPQAWAKNIVSVGGIFHNATLARSDDTWTTASYGPALDGRVKPDVAHFYDNVFTATAFDTTTQTAGDTFSIEFSGTSASTPIVAGAFGLFFQMWHQQVFPGFGGGSSVFADRCHMTTAKAMMINTSFRYNWLAGGPNGNLDRTKQGWGMPDLANMYALRNKMFIIDQGDILTNAQSRAYTVTVAPGEPVLGATMTYPDPMGATGGGQARVNDISLRVTSPTGQVYWGNNGLTASNFSTIGGSANTVDTVENVFVQSPAPGNWNVEVLATQIVQDAFLADNSTDAVYSLVVSGATQTNPPSLVISLPGGFPALVAPGTPASISVNIAPGTQHVLAGSPTLWYRTSGTGAFTGVPLQALGGPSYLATLPGQTCASAPQFYITAQGDQGGPAACPINAPANFYTTQIGTAHTSTLFTESFESGLPSGWSATGLWHVSAICAPGGACDGTHWAYYGQDASCTYDTGVANSGLLTAPQITLPSLSPGESLALSYCSAKQSENSPGYDMSTVIANGSVVDTANESPIFQTRTVDLTPFAGQTVSLQWSFNTVDNLANTFRGWHVDNVRISATTISCTNPSPCYPNCDGSTGVPFLNVQDFTCFMQKFATGNPYANCDQSTNPPVLNVQDFTCFLQKFAIGCSAP